MKNLAWEQCIDLLSDYRFLEDSFRLNRFLNFHFFAFSALEKPAFSALSLIYRFRFKRANTLLRRFIQLLKEFPKNLISLFQARM